MSEVSPKVSPRCAHAHYLETQRMSEYHNLRGFAGYKGALKWRPEQESNLRPSA